MWALWKPADLNRHGQSSCFCFLPHPHVFLFIPCLCLSWACLPISAWLKLADESFRLRAWVVVRQPFPRVKSNLKSARVSALLFSVICLIPDCYFFFFPSFCPLPYLLSALCQLCLLSFNLPCILCFWLPPPTLNHSSSYALHACPPSSYTLSSPPPSPAFLIIPSLLLHHCNKQQTFFFRLFMLTLQPPFGAKCMIDHTTPKVMKNTYVI